MKRVQRPAALRHYDADVVDYLNAAQSAFHCVAEVTARLVKNGFEVLDELAMDRKTERQVHCDKEREFLRLSPSAASLTLRRRAPSASALTLIHPVQN